MRSEVDLRYRGFADTQQCSDFLDNRLEQDDFDMDWRELQSSDTGCPQMEMYNPLLEAREVIRLVHLLARAGKTG